MHVYHDSALPTSPLRPGQPGNAPKPEALPRPGGPMYRKTVDSAFIGTTLEDDLRRRGANTLVAAGLTTNHCVSTTTRMAGNFGFATYLLADATATFDCPGPDGQTFPATLAHAVALGDLHGEFATVVDAAALGAAVAAPAATAAPVGAV